MLVPEYVVPPMVKMSYPLSVENASKEMEMSP